MQHRKLSTGRHKNHTEELLRNVCVFEMYVEQ